MNGDDDAYMARWQHRTVEFLFGGARYQLTISTNPQGMHDEIVVTGPRTGSAMSYIVLDACTLINALLNRYVSIDALTELVQRNAEGGAESVIGEMIFQLAQSP
jgi:hypothetical protein